MQRGYSRPGLVTRYLQKLKEACAWRSQGKSKEADLWVSLEREGQQTARGSPGPDCTGPCSLLGLQVLL